jgi:aminoglycoside phosphotransferase (APT) family kinase protein
MGGDLSAFGHRGGVAHEATVYQELLDPLTLSTPWLYGVYEDASSGRLWLVLDFLEGTIRVQKSLDPAAMGLAARWIGQFHAATELRLQKTEIPFLKKYDAAYYLGWSQRTLRYAGGLRQRFPWLESLCERFEEAVTALLSAPPTVIHGEYYPKNILYREGKIHPIDWETTAIAPGEIDLASLTEAWPEEIVRECELQYQAARWPGGPPDHLRQVLCAARLYLHFRWLGASLQKAVNNCRFLRLHSLGRELGLI